jgi:hypothetical protein
VAGDPDNAALWANADVYVSMDRTAPDPETTWEPWPVEWGLVGLLDGEAGFEQEREDDVEEFHAWGGILVRTSKNNHKRKFKFTCLERNAVTFGLVNPGSVISEPDANGMTTSRIRVPKNIRFAMGMELREAGKTRRRLIDRAEITEIGTIKESEQELEKYEITVAVIPDGDSILYRELEGPDEAPDGGSN